MKKCKFGLGACAMSWLTCGMGYVWADNGAVAPPASLPDTGVKQLRPQRVPQPETEVKRLFPESFPISLRGWVSGHRATRSKNLISCLYVTEQGARYSSPTLILYSAMDAQYAPAV